MEGCRKIVAPSTGRGIFPCVGTQGPDTWSNRAMIDIENFLSALLAAYGGTSVPGMSDSSSKGDGNIQAMAGSTPMIFCAVHALNIIGIWFIGKSLLEAINQVHLLVNLSGISFGLFY